MRMVEWFSMRIVSAFWLEAGVCSGNDRSIDLLCRLMGIPIKYCPFNHLHRSSSSSTTRNRSGCLKMSQLNDDLIPFTSSTTKKKLSRVTSQKQKKTLIILSLKRFHKRSWQVLKDFWHFYSNFKQKITWNIIFFEMLLISLALLWCWCVWFCHT